MSTELGTFGALFAVRREQKQEAEAARREAEQANRERDIAALEDWHHAWRLEHDEDYRALHPFDWCSLHRGLTSQCARHRCDITKSVRRVGETRLAYEVPMTDDERRRATRRMADWGRGSA